MPRCARAEPEAAVEPAAPPRRVWRPPAGVSPAPPGPLEPDWSQESAALAAGYERVAGCDEVGRGALAGPLVAAAVVFPPALIRAAGGQPDEALGACLAELAGVRDSKLLTPAARRRLDACVRRQAQVGVGWVSAGLCDAIGMGAANRLALTRALRALPAFPDYALIDACRLPLLPIPHLALIKGDSRVVSIAAASIVAKVARDALLEEYDARWPGYGFAENKGYGAPAHHAALRAHGPTPEHRRSFDPLRSMLAGATPEDAPP
jgi:ribonuclease HII